MPWSLFYSDHPGGHVVRIIQSGDARIKKPPESRFTPCPPPCFYDKYICHNEDHVFPITAFDFSFYTVDSFDINFDTIWIVFDLVTYILVIIVLSAISLFYCSVSFFMKYVSTTGTAIIYALVEKLHAIYNGCYEGSCLNNHLCYVVVLMYTNMAAIITTC